MWTLRYSGTAVTELLERTSTVTSSSGGPATISSFAEDDSGEVYIIDYSAGRIFKIWPGVTDRGGGWKELDWLRVYNDLSFPWIFHDEHGWLFWASALHSSVWFFSTDMGWLWTSRDIYPYLYRASDGVFLFFVEGSTPRAFFDFTTQSWEFR